MQNPLKNLPVKILLVEDDEFLLRLYASKFTAENFLVYSARDGLSALRVFRECLPQVLILDIDLPEISGSDVLQILANDFNKPSPLCLVLTNYDRDIVEEKSPLPDVVAGYFIKINTTPQEIVNFVKIYYPTGT